MAKMAALTMLLSLMSAFSAPEKVFGSKTSLRSTSFCKEFKCEIIKEYQNGKTKSVTYRLTYTNNIYHLFTAYSKERLSYASIYLGNASLMYGPTNHHIIIESFFRAMTGINRDNNIKIGILNCFGAIDTKNSDYFDFYQTSVNGQKVALYCHSSPDSSLDEKYGELAYGITLLSHFPPR